MTDKRIRIILDSRQAKKNADQLSESTKDIGRSADSSAFSMKRLAVAIAGVISVQKVAQYADAWTRVENQLKRTTSSQEDLAATSRLLLNVANDTRAGLEPTVELYTSLTVATRDLQLSQEQITGVTKTINNLFLESGKGAAETAGAIRQLGQALESGALRGDEFNSVAEGAPGILRAVQEQTGLTRGELRELAAQGKITAELLVTSLENYGDEAQKAADKTRATLGQAFDASGNNITFFIGQIDDATGASAGLAEAIIDASKTLGSDEFIAAFIENIDIARLTINATSDSVGDLSNELQLFSDIGAGSVSLVGRAFSELIPNIRSVIQITTVSITSWVDATKSFYSGVLDILKLPFTDGQIHEAVLSAIEGVRKGFAEANDNRKDSIDLILQERQAILDQAAALRTARLEEAAARKAKRDAVVIGGSSIQTASAEAPTTSREVDGARKITEALQKELDARTQAAQIYRDQVIANDENLYLQQLGLIAIREAEELARLEAKAATDAQRREEVLARQLESDKIAEDQKKILRDEFKNQELISEQIFEQEKTRILQEASKARQDLERAEYNARLAMVGQFGSDVMTIAQGQSKGLFQIGKAAALSSATVEGYHAAVSAWEKGMQAGGPPLAAGFLAASVAKTGALIKGITSQKFGSGGGSISAGGGATSGGSSPAAPTTAQQVELTQQRRIIDLRGIGPDTLITGAQLKGVLESDDSVVVAFENARIEAQRRNVIGVEG